MQEEWLEMLTHPVSCHPSIWRRACIVRRMAPVKVKGMAIARLLRLPFKHQFVALVLPSLFYSPVPLSLLTAHVRTNAHSRRQNPGPSQPRLGVLNLLLGVINLLLDDAGKPGGGRHGIRGHGGEEQGRHGCHHHHQPGKGGQARTRGGQGARPPDPHHLQVAHRRHPPPPPCLSFVLTYMAPSTIVLVYVGVSLIGFGFRGC